MEQSIVTLVMSIVRLIIVIFIGAMTVTFLEKRVKPIYRHMIFAIYLLFCVACGMFTVM